MKVGIYDPYLDSLAGGERYMLTMAKCLSNNNEVCIFWDDKDILEKAKDKLGLDLNNVKVRPNIFSPNNSILKRLSQSRKYDLIVFLSDGSIPLLLSKKIILHFQYPCEWLKIDPIKFEIKKLKINKIICNSHFTKAYIDKKFNVKSLVLYPPVDTQSFDGIKKKENIILTVGRFSELPDGKDFKKQSVLIEIFKKMLKKGLKGWEFHIVSSNLPKDEEKVELLLKKIASKNIIFHRNIKNPEIVSLYKKAKIYWHAAGYDENLEKYPERAEHFGISTVEAMAAGVVPVVIDAGGQKEIIKEGYNGFLWNNLDQLIDKTYILIKDEDLMQKMSQNAAEISSEFNTEIFCREIHHIINNDLAPL